MTRWCNGNTPARHAGDLSWFDSNTGHFMNRDLKKQAIALRVNDRLSIKAIHKKIGASVGSLSVWLRDYPLSQEEIISKIGEAQKLRREKFLQKREDSKYYNMLNGRELSKHEKMKVSESAVLFRLVLNGFNPYCSVFDGDKIDWLVVDPCNMNIIKVEVRTTKIQRYGQPLISLRCSNGRKKTKAA